MASGNSKTRKIRFWWSLSLAFIQKYKTRILITLLILIAAIFFSVKSFNYLFRMNEVSIGYVGSNTLENIPTSVLALVTGSLVKTDTSGRPEPSLASQWTVTEDGKTYVIFIRDNLLWHDDTPVVAKDISLAIQNVKINALNDRAIQFVLPNPIPSFLLALDKPIFKTNTFYGTGEYRIVKIDKVNEVVKKISLFPKSGNLPKVKIKFYPTGTQAIYALKIGDIQSLTVANTNEFTSWPNMDVTKKIDDRQIVTVFYNNEDESIGSKDIRQALSYAINRGNFDGVLAYSPISQSSWAYNANIKRYDYNTAKAKELLSKGTNKKITITLSYTSELEEVAKDIKTDWEAIGVDVDLKLEKKVPDQFQALLAVDSLPPDPDQYSLWHSTQTKTNITHYKNVKIDKLLEDGRSTQDETQRESYYSDFQKFLIEDEPATFLYYPYAYTLTYKNIKPKLDAIKNIK